MSKFRTGQCVSIVTGDDVTLTRLIPDGAAFAGQWEGVLTSGDECGCTGIWEESELVRYTPPTKHYTPDSTGKDYLARCEDTFSREEMIGAYRFTIGKYVDRMGKKAGEPVEKELAKIIDYATRAKAWLERSDA
jgi:hypothetical protein